MGQIATLGNAAFRDYVTDGVPASGRNDPHKPDIRVVFDTIDAAVAAASAARDSWSENLLPNGDFSIWTTIPAFASTVTNAGGGAGFASHSLPDNWYGGPGFGAQSKFTRRQFEDGEEDAGANNSQFYGELEWIVAPDAPNRVEYTEADRQPIFENPLPFTTSAFMGKTFCVSFRARVSAGTLTASPVLFLSQGVPLWLESQLRTVGVNEYVQNVAFDNNGDDPRATLFIYEATVSGSCGREVANVANNGGGKVRITLTDTTAAFTTGDVLKIAHILGTTEANGDHEVTVVDANNLDLLDVNFSNAYISGGWVAKPPVHTTIGQEVSDGGVMWKCLGLLKGRGYDIYEHGPLSESEGQVYASTHEGDPAAPITLTTEWQDFTVVIAVPPHGYSNVTDYADSWDSVRTLIPTRDDINYGPIVGIRPSGMGLALDVLDGMSKLVTGFKIDVTDVVLNEGVTPIAFKRRPETIEQMLALPFSTRLSILMRGNDLDESVKTGILVQTANEDAGAGATFTHRSIASAVPGLSFTHADGTTGNPTLNGPVGPTGGGTGLSAANDVAATFISRKLDGGIGGSTNNSSSGSGAFVNHTPTVTVPANYLVSGRMLRITAVFTLTTDTPTGLDFRLRLGSTTVVQYGPQTPISSVTALTFSVVFLVVAEAAPGAAANVRSTVHGHQNAFVSAALLNSIAQPVALATNGSLAIEIGSQWAGAGTGTNTVTLSDVVVETIG